MSRRLIVLALLPAVVGSSRGAAAEQGINCWTNVVTDELICETGTQGSPADTTTPPRSPSQPTPGPANPSSDALAAPLDLCSYRPQSPDGPMFMEPRVDPDGTVWVFVRKDCPGEAPSYEWWRSTAADPAQAATAPLVVTPQMLIPDAHARVVRVLPKPIPRIVPADVRPDGYAFVQMPTVFWVDQAPGQWATVSGTASVPSLSVTVQAVPVRLLVDTGNGDSVSCDGPPPPFRVGIDDIERFGGCQYVYTDSSAMSDNGETFPVVVSIVWQASWSASNGESGDLGTLTTTSDVRQLGVAEIQAIVVTGNG